MRGRRPLYADSPDLFVPLPLTCAAATMAQNPLDKLKEAAKSVTDTVDKTVNGTKSAVNSVTNGKRHAHFRQGCDSVPAVSRIAGPMFAQ